MILVERSRISSWLMVSSSPSAGRGSSAGIEACEVSPQRFSQSKCFPQNVESRIGTAAVPRAARWSAGSGSSACAAGCETRPRGHAVPPRTGDSASPARGVWQAGRGSRAVCFRGPRGPDRGARWPAGACGRRHHVGQAPGPCCMSVRLMTEPSSPAPEPVSYTHLTLPTILRV